jgi:uncharacterized RDD family membrane protein YckC
VKCPKCGFVSFPGPAECKKCGYRFASAASHAAAAGAQSVFSRFETPQTNPEAALQPIFLTDPTQGVELPAAQSSLPAGGVAGASTSAPALPPLDLPAVNAPLPSPQSWEDELAERVARYKRRRTKSRADSASSRANLEFEFGQTGCGGGEDALDVDLQPQSHRETQAPLLDSMALDRRRGEVAISDEQGAEWMLELRNDPPSGPAEVEPVEIVLGETQGAVAAEQPEERLAAPIGPRLAAGVIDALILALAAGVFAVVFMISGGRWPDRQLGLAEAMGAFTAAFFVLFYFALFSAVTSATPGQSLMGLRVRTLDDRRPDWPSARRRAAGYLVSAAALGIGFVWAAFDGQGLTWHDRMSGTCLALAREPGEEALIAAHRAREAGFEQGTVS